MVLLPTDNPLAGCCFSTSRQNRFFAASRIAFAIAHQGNRVLILGKTGQELFKGAFAPAASLAFAAEASF
jgi:hypothetical protein